MENEKVGPHFMARRRQVLLVLSIVPLVIAIGIVPLVVFLKVYPVPLRYRQFWPTALVFDFFSYYKAQIILVCAGLLLLMGTVNAWYRQFPKKSNPVFFPLAIYAMAMIVSAARSSNPSIAFNGSFDREEGLWVMLAYLVLFLGTYLFVSGIGQVRLLLGAWGGAVGLMCILGILQYVGLDFFQTQAGRLLILPPKYQYLAASLHFTFPRSYSYGTLYNPNNLASMLALALPPAAALFVLARSRKTIWVVGGLAGLLVLALLGTNGRSAWIAVLLALGSLAVYFRWRQVPGWWKRLAVLAAIALVGFVGFNLSSRGGLSEYVAQPVNEVTNALQSFGNPEPAGAPAGVAAGGPALQTNAHTGFAEQLIRKYGTVASGRGYIWIRSIQMAGRTPILGHGPDTFALYFPNTDPYKAFYSQPEVFIDKPHDLYLQLWINLGGIAALAFLAMAVMHTVRTIKVLNQADAQDAKTILAVGLFLGWLAYLVAAIFYDSSVSVAPAFWIVFGLSLSVNEMLIPPAC